MTLRDYCNLRDWGVGVCGRHPFNGNIPEKDVEAFARLAMLGDLTGAGHDVDPELGGAFLALGGKNKELQAALKQAGIKSLAPEEGFRVYNYGGFGVHRRGDWMITLKGYNSDVWSTEIYAADNRFGRYISYGSAQLIGSGGAEASGYVQDGWDWNRYPGVTSIHLPFEKLESPLPGTLMEKNTSRFPGVSSLEGMNGCLAFTYTERDRVNFCSGATATKSVFCFDNRIIHIGTGITNDSSYPTETTIYQLKLDEKTEEVDVADTKGNVYIIRNGYGVTVEKKSQTSPSDTKKKTGTGNFITAYIDHGTSPQNASYEYLMLVRPSSKDEGRFAKKLPYTVIQADNHAHVVRDDITGITAYISYGGYASEETLVAGSEPETIVMERTRDDGKVVMSVCTPDLGITEKGYTTTQQSQKKVILKGTWSLSSPSENVDLIIEDGNTVISAICLHGQPVEFTLNNN